MSASTLTPTPAAATKAAELPLLQRIVRTLLTQRVALLGVLIVVVLAVMMSLDTAGMLSGSYDTDYLASTLISAVPVAILGFAQLIVILSGKAGIDLSVGAVVSISGVVFGFSYGVWGLGLVPAILLTALTGVVCGAINGYLIAYIGFPPLIATLATFYALKSLAMVVSGQRPINSQTIQDFYSAARPVELPLIGQYLPDFPMAVFTFLLPAVVLMWLLLNRTAYGRRAYAIGTNDDAAKWAGIDTRRTRMIAYITAGGLASMAAVVIVAQFASARPDAGTAGNGLALPAITIAVLGGVAITGGIGRVAGVLLATLLVVWLNAGLLLAIPGNPGTQMQLLAMGIMLIGAALLNNYASKRYGIVK